ncbi:MAG: tetratricopeptide repeat protein, partial [Acidobacteria bacterium]|nr:tetratricopeptide repeat protein [Acidobacteriota bacterium]
MPIYVRHASCVLLLAAAVAAVAGSESTPDSARSELQLEFADLLLDDERYWEALQAYTLAKEGAKPEQMLRASAGSLRSAITVAEFTRAYQEALFLGEQGVEDPGMRTLRADAFWSAGLFDEAEAMYRDILSAHAAHAGARHGLARSLAAGNRAADALAEVRAAIAADDRPEYHHTLGSIYRRLGRYPEAAAALAPSADPLPNVRGHRRT